VQRLSAEFRDDGGAQTLRGELLLACREVRWTAELCMSVDLRAIGLLTTPRRDLFPYPTGLARPTVTRVLRSGFILSCPQSSSQFLRRFLPATPFKAACPAKVSSLFATSPEPSTNTGAHLLPLCSAHRLSQPLDGLLRLRLRGLISSHCHVQGLFRPGDSPDPQPT
jgi:hypothetical protein